MANHLVLRCVLVGGTSWKEVRHAGTGNPSIGCILLCGFGPAWCFSTPPCCSGSKQKPSWACGTGLAVCGCSCGTPTQTSSCGSEFILLDGSKCAALARLMVPTILASRARQKWVAVLASAAGRGHVVMREGRPRWLCRVARWSFLIKPLQWQLGQHAYCLGTAAQSLWVGFEGIVVWYVRVVVTRCERFIHTYVHTAPARVRELWTTF